MTDKELLDQYAAWINKCAHKYKYASKYADIEDLRSVGMMAVFEARDIFDKTKGTKLSTHIMNIIRYRILTEVACNQLFPRHQINGLMTLRKIKRQLGEEATPEEISKWMKAHYNGPLQWSPNTVRRFEQLDNIRVSSIQAIQENEDINADKYLPYTQVDYEGELDKKIRRQNLAYCIKELPEKMQQVIESRLHNKTLNEIAQVMYLSKERVRQLEKLAIKKLKEMFKKSPSVRPEELKTYTQKEKTQELPPQKKVEEHVQEMKIQESPKQEKPAEATSVRVDASKIHPLEYKLSSSVFKLLQFLKNYKERDPEQIARFVHLSTSYVILKMGVLWSSNILDHNFKVLDVSLWKLTFKNSQKKVAPTVSEINVLDLQRGQVICNGLYEITEIWPNDSRVEVRETNSMKHTILKASEILI